jgi:hypothetical protein
MSNSFPINAATTRLDMIGGDVAIAHARRIALWVEASDGLTNCGKPCCRAST